MCIIFIKSSPSADRYRRQRTNGSRFRSRLSRFHRFLFNQKYEDESEDQSTLIYPPPPRYDDGNNTQGAYLTIEQDADDEEDAEGTYFTLNVPENIPGPTTLCL